MKLPERYRAYIIFRYSSALILSSIFYWYAKTSVTGAFTMLSVFILLSLAVATIFKLNPKRGRKRSILIIIALCIMTIISILILPKKYDNLLIFSYQFYAFLYISIKIFLYIVSKAK